MISPFPDKKLFCNNNKNVRVDHQVFLKTLSNIIKPEKIEFFKGFLISTVMQDSWCKVHTRDTKRNLLDSNWPAIIFPSAYRNMMAETTSPDSTVAWTPFLVIRHVMNVPRNHTGRNISLRAAGSHNDSLHII